MLLGQQQISPAKLYYCLSFLVIRINAVFNPQSLQTITVYFHHRHSTALAPAPFPLAALRSGRLTRAITHTHRPAPRPPAPRCAEPRRYLSPVPTRYVLVPCRVIGPGLQPSTRTTRDDSRSMRGSSDAMSAARPSRRGTAGGKAEATLCLAPPPGRAPPSEGPSPLRGGTARILENDGC